MRAVWTRINSHHRIKGAFMYYSPESYNAINKNSIQSDLLFKLLSTKSPPSITPSEAGKIGYKSRSEEDDRSHRENNIETILSHAGLSSSLSSKFNHDNGSSQNEPLCPPINLATTFTRPPSGDYDDVDDGGRGWVYGRMGNPTRTTLEECLSELEIIGGKMYNRDSDQKTMTSVFSSGMAAVSAVIMAKSQKGLLHIIIPDDLYHGVRSQLALMFGNEYENSKDGCSHHRGVSYSTIDMTSLSRVQEHVADLYTNGKNNIILWMETPSNPLCKVTDIQAVCGWVEEQRSQSEDNNESQLQLTTIVDSTWAPPIITQPILLGADAVLHSGTKYLGGHSDCLLGTVTTSPSQHEMAKQIRSLQISIGSIASPFDSWLVLRGLRTLHVRLEQQCRSALELAEFLSQHPHVSKVHYPGLETHPQHNIAKHQMKNGRFGGMLSFEVQNEAMAMAVAGAVRTVVRATSLGGTETLLEHRASIEPEEMKTSPEGLLRVSVGLESIEDLKRDFDLALNTANKLNF